MRRIDKEKSKTIQKNRQTYARNNKPTDIVTYVVGNLFITPYSEHPPSVYKRRSAEYQQFGQFDTLVDAFRCFKANPGACITRIWIFSDRIWWFEHYLGVESSDFSVKGEANKFLSVIRKGSTNEP